MPSVTPSASANLIEPRDPFVGRDSELARVLQAIDDGTRLLTLTGPAGVGKSRLALHSVLAIQARGDTTVVRVDASACASMAALWDALGGALQISDDATGNRERFGRALAARGTVLLLLDDFDALVSEGTAPLGALLESVPESCVLVTSRQRLGLPDELVIDVGSLGFAAAQVNDGTFGDAAKLLMALASRQGVAIAVEELPLVEALVRELDGIPLAIQLAASRLPVMGPRVLLHRLRANRSILERSGRAPGDRHASLEAALEGSWNALLPHEREALAQCTVFCGSFDLDAAEAVVDLSAHPQAAAVVDTIQALRDKSMLQVLSPTSGDLGPRLLLYRSIRAFAAARLAPETAQALDARHADYYVAMAAAAPSPIARRARLHAERENLLAVVERILGHGPVTARRAEPALRALLLLAPGFVARHPVQSLLRAIDPIIDVTRDSGADPLLYARVLALRGALRRPTHRASSTRDLVRALSMARTLGAAQVEGLCLMELGRSLRETHAHEEARQHLEQALTLFHGAGALPEEAACLALLGDLDRAADRLDPAAALFARAIALHDSLEDLPGLASSLRQLANLHLDRGDLAGAEPLLARARDAAAQSADPVELARCAVTAALIEQDSDRFESAALGFYAAVSALRDAGESGDESLALGYLGVLRSQCGHHGEAYALLRSACVGLEPSGADPLALFQAHLAWLDRIAGRDQAAHSGFEQARTSASRAQCPWLDAAVATLHGGATSPRVASPSVHERIARRIVELPAARDSAAPPPPDDALVVGPKAAWLRLPDGNTLDLERRRPLARIIVRLAQERAAPQPRALGWDDLLAAGWPGEKVLPSAGAHRVRVAVSTLRKLGLGELLKTSEDGYELDPSTPVVALDGD